MSPTATLVVQIAAILALLAIIWWKISPWVMFRIRSEQTKGKIVNWMSMREKGVEYFYPLIQFRDVKGIDRKYRAEERCEGRPMYPIGTEVEVTFDPKKPEKVKTKYP